MTVNDAINAQSPSIYTLSKFSLIQTKALLTVLIGGVIEFLNVGKTMNDNQLAETIELILSDPNYKNLKPDDFKVCFDNAKKSYYGKNYDRIDGQVIFEWLGLYMNERSNIIESKSILNASHETKKTNSIIPSPEIINALKSVINELPKDLKKEKKVIVKSERDILIQKCLTEFDELADRKPSLDENGKQIPGKYIDHEITDVVERDKKGKVTKTITHVRPIDQIEYTKIKVTEYDILINQNKNLEL